jgi:hypothetical protein
VAQASQAGVISQQAAQQVSAGLADVVGSLEAGNTPDAQKKLAALTQKAGALEGGGQIGAAAATALNAALGALGSAVGAPSTPAAGGASAGAGRPVGRGVGPPPKHGRGSFGRGGSFPG